ncbi:putative integral membrane protein [Acanthocheilonema viteae]
MCIVTAISISSNGKCKKGGLYYYMQYQGMLSNLSILMLITLADQILREETAALVMFSLYHLSFLDWCFGSLLLSSNAATISGILYPAWCNGNFISVYAVLFLGMTGLMAGSMFISELKDQAYDVPIGMFTAIRICIFSNLISVFIPAATMLPAMQCRHLIM